MLSNNNIYISAPVSLDWSTVLSFKESIRRKSRDLNICMWDRKEIYKQSELDSCNTIVFLLPKNQFKADSLTLPSGLRNELARAYAKGMNILVGYKSSLGSFRVYNTETNGIYINGIIGTADKCFEHIEKITLEKDIPSYSLPAAFRLYEGICQPTSFTYDERLLLMI